MEKNYRREIEILKGKREFKNYKDLCNHLGWEISAGNVKKKQMKELDLICRFSKNGNKFIIEEIYEENIEKKLYKKDRVSFEKLKVPREKRECAGIYLLSNDNKEVYVGSTVCLRNRFTQHKRGHGLTNRTQKILEAPGGKMELLQEIDLNKVSIEEMRRIEELYIEEYLNNSDLICINVQIITPKIHKEKISKEQQIKICELLVDNLKNADLNLTKRQYDYIVNILGGQASE